MKPSKTYSRKNMTLSVSRKGRCRPSHSSRKARLSSNPQPRHCLRNHSYSTSKPQQLLSLPYNNQYTSSSKSTSNTNAPPPRNFPHPYPHPLSLPPNNQTLFHHPCKIPHQTTPYTATSFAKSLPEISIPPTGPCSVAQDPRIKSLCMSSPVRYDHPARHCKQPHGDIIFGLQTRGKVTEAIWTDCA